jgi:hypothetical protein
MILAHRPDLTVLGDSPPAWAPAPLIPLVTARFTVLTWRMPR